MHYYELHFGTYDKARHARVTEVISLMDFAVNSASVAIQYNIGCGGNTNAAAYPPEGGWSAQNIKKVLKSGGFKMSLCPRFFGAMPQNDRMAQNRTGTFVHELSHIVGNTNDVADNHVNGAPITADPVGFTYYGRANARQLADYRPELAIENAENYGFYVSDLLADARNSAEVDFEGLPDLFA